MRYLITGITGFAGPHLANLLIKEGHTVFGLVRHSNGRETDLLDIISPEDFKQIKFIYADLCHAQQLDQELKKLNRLDGIFHLAAQSHPPTSFLDPVGTFETNVMGSINLIESVIKNFNMNTKFMFCSTSEVYGNTCRAGEILHEYNQILPSNPYGNSKAAIDLYMQERMTNNQLNGFITRAFSHTGPRRGKNFSISSDAFQLAMIASGKQEPVLKVGNLETVRVVLDVRDVVRAYYLLMLHPYSSGEIYNVCGLQPREMGFYTNKLIEKTGMSDIKTEIDPTLYRPIDINYQHGSVLKLIKLTNWQPMYDIDQTLEDLLNYWKGKLSGNIITH